MPHLVQVQRDYEDESFSIILVTKATAVEMRAFADRHELNFPVLAEAHETLDAFGVSMIWGSEFYLVDPQGYVVARGVGEAEERLARELSAARD
jgi:peroxiredoxin